MPLIDDRGRLFGTVNLIDALVGAFVLLLVPLAYGAFLLFRVPVPTVTAVEPAAVLEHEPATLKVTGQNLRPFLRVYFGTTASGDYLIQSPTLAEVKVPNLAAGSYDLVLFDEGKELVRVPAALTVVVAYAPALATLAVQFVVRPQVAEYVKAGIEDLGGATLTALKAPPQRTTGLTAIDVGVGRLVQMEQPVAVFEATVRAPVMRTPAGLLYRGKPVRAGALLTFETFSYSMDGSILDVRIEPEPPTR